jgi:DNA adenine methylase
LSRGAVTQYLSPLRYPGGKATISSFVAELIEAQRQRLSRYVEPFAGGAGVGLRLLFDEHVDEIVLNDLDSGVAAFWRAVFGRTSELTDKVKATLPTLKEWHRQRAIYINGGSSDLQLGFATFFLNRTNRSGILNARPIGGLNQTGKWGIDARYNGERLAERITRLGEYSSRVTICSEDGIDLLSRYLNDEHSFIYVDPPYLQKGDDLYLDNLNWSDHERLAKELKPARNWMLTYDKDPRALKLYPTQRCALFGIAHTAGVQHIGNEYAVFADGLVIPTIRNLGRGDARFVRRSSVS